MKITKLTKDNTTTYFYDGVKKYEYLKDPDIYYEEWREYDTQGNEIHFKDSYGQEYWKEYDRQGNEIYFKNSTGYQEWKEYDKRGNEIHYKRFDGYEWWKEYDEQGNEIHRKDTNGYEWRKEDNPDNQENKLIEIKEEDVKSFTFTIHI